MVEPQQLGEIPDKLYFKIGEVCEMTGLKPHTLRFWESEFAAIRPKRAGSNQRLYRRQDVETILRIKSLIYDEGRTIAGTRKFLAQEREGKKKESTKPRQRKQKDSALLRRVKTELQELQNFLAS